MSGKRGAGDQITRENFREFEDDDEEGPSQPSRATADVIAQRKILKPRGRLAKSSTSATAAAAPSSSGFSFGAPTDSSSGAPKVNAFAGFGGFGKSADTAPPTSTFNFTPPAQKTNLTEEPPKSNAFGFLSKSNTTEEANKDTSKVQPLLSFINNNNNNSAGKTSTSLVSTKNIEKASKIKALNDTFYTKITQEKQANPVSNFTPILRKYIDYYDQIDRDIDIPDADSEPQQQTQQKALTAAPSAPSFNFGQVTKPVVPSFNFGQQATLEKSEEPESIDVSTGEDEAKDGNDDSAAIVVESDSDSDDDIKVEGPTFTLAKPPTTTDSVFKLTSDATTTKSSGTGPTFTFAGTGSKKFDSPFKLSKPVEEKKSTQEEEEKKPAADTPKPAFGTTNNFTWSPGQPISFSNDKADNEKPTTKFNFSATPSKESSESTAKPAFTFGSKPTETVQSDSNSKPSGFSFGSSTTPAFSFGSNTPAVENEDKTEEVKKPAFSFGAPSSTGFSFGGAASDSTTKPSFSFGSTDTTTKPSFSFGGTSAAPSMGTSSFNFSFSGSKSVESKTSTDGAADEDGGAAEEEADVNFKPVTELKDKVEEKTGEEDEEATFIKRAKLMLFVPENKESPYVSKGLGELKVLKHKETGKYRLLVRADGSNRPILNVAVSKQFTYSGMGKGLVKVPTVGADGKLETYMVKVKTDADARNLIKSLTDAQS